MKTLLYLIGVSGCGKSTVGEGVAAKTGGIFLDGDDFHPPANKEKMGSGIPLTDEDRWPWLDRLREVAAEKLETGENPVILACSGLKRVYRDRLLRNWPDDIDARMVHLAGSQALISSRLADRDHEYMPASLLDSQFATLETPDSTEEVIEVSIDQSPEAIVAEIAMVIGSNHR